MRLLHIVLNCRDLRRSVQFFGDVLCFRVLRHEEFEVECEAQCNGPFEGHWSKSMVGTDEAHGFVLELTFNYGVNDYLPADDLRFIAALGSSSDDPWQPFRPSHAVSAAQALQCQCDETAGVVFTPDRQKIQFFSPENNRCTRATDPILFISLRVSDLEKTKKFWCDGLGMTQFSASVVREQLGCLHVPDEGVFVGVDLENQIPLHLCQEDRAVVHSPGSGRLAIAVESAAASLAQLQRGTLFGGQLLKDLTVLSTPGKADVEVVILADPDSYEVCLVSDRGFADLSAPFPGCDFVNWRYREAKIEKMKKFHHQK